VSDEQTRLLQEILAVQRAHFEMVQQHNEWELAAHQQMVDRTAAVGKSYQGKIFLSAAANIFFAFALATVIGLILFKVAT
jgi:hypothetical protein